MKKMLLMALLGLGLVLACEQRASAWSKFNFGVGFNVGYEGGGNSVLFGVFKGEQPPVGVEPSLGHGPDVPMVPSMPGGPYGPEQASPKTMPPAVSRAAYEYPEAERQPEAAGYSVPSYSAPSYWYGR